MEKTVFEEDARIYELGFHLLPTLAEDNRQQALEQVEQAITKQGGQKISEGKPEHVELAYPMDLVIDNKRTTFRNAYFGWFKFEMLPEDLDTLREDLDAHRGLLRYLLIATVREDTMVSPRKEREDSGDVTMEPKEVPAEDIKNPAEDESEEVDEVELDAKLDDMVSPEDESEEEAPSEK